MDLAHDARMLAEQAAQLTLLLAHDSAQAGDYARAVTQIGYRCKVLTKAAVTAEIARGSSWEQIGHGLRTTAEEAERAWQKEVDDGLDGLSSNLSPGRYGTICWATDQWIATLPKNSTPFLPKPIGPILDASATWTGRDAARANQMFVARPLPASARREVAGSAAAG